MSAPMYGYVRELDAFEKNLVFAQIERGKIRTVHVHMTSLKFSPDGARNPDLLGALPSQTSSSC